MDRYKGFTLIELVVVLALFSLLFSIAMPSFKVLYNYEQDQELKEFRKNILFARNQSIVKGEPHRVAFDYERNYYVIESNGKNIQSHYFKNGVQLILKPFNLEDSGVIEVEFGRNGVPNHSGTVFIRLDNKKIYGLSVTPATGKVNLKEY